MVGMSSTDPELGLRSAAAASAEAAVSFDNVYGQADAGASGGCQADPRSAEGKRQLDAFRQASGRRTSAEQVRAAEQTVGRSPMHEPSSPTAGAAAAAGAVDVEVDTPRGARERHAARVAKRASVEEGRFAEGESVNPMLAQAIQRGESKTTGSFSLRR